MSKLNLAEILKDCPAGTELWSPLFGLGAFIAVVDKDRYPIHVQFKNNYGEKDIRTFSRSGVYFDEYERGECVLFPSRYNRAWSTFKVEKPKFDVSSLQPFDKVLVRFSDNNRWVASFFSFYIKGAEPFVAMGVTWPQCIPYNDDTKHLLGTTTPAPESYVTWDK